VETGNPLRLRAPPPISPIGVLYPSLRF